MKKKVLLLSFLSNGFGLANVRDVYLVFRGRYTDNSFLLTSIGNYTLAMQSLNLEDLTKVRGFVSYLPIPLTGPVKFLLRADVNGVKSILVLSVDENRMRVEPATEFDELTEDISYQILQCFTLKRKGKFISFLLQPNKNKAAKRRHQPDSNDNNPEKL